MNKHIVKKSTKICFNLNFHTIKISKKEKNYFKFLMSQANGNIHA